MWVLTFWEKGKHVVRGGGGHWAGCTDLVATRKGAFLAFGGQMGDQRVVEKVQ